MSRVSVLVSIASALGLRGACDTLYLGVHGVRGVLGVYGSHGHLA